MCQLANDSFFIGYFFLTRFMTKKIFSLLLIVAVFACTPKSEIKESWCDQSLRPAFSQMEEVKTSSAWFKVYKVGDGVFAMVEPYNFQEVISYLITGTTTNILFDSGMGMSSISKVVKELSNNPVIVINSHTHFDHIGGNFEFDSVYAVDTAYTKHFAEAGWTHTQVQQEVRTDAFCGEKLPTLDTANYFIKPYKDKIIRYIKDADIVDLGGRQIEILQTPGHTPDGISLLDRANGYLWTGDAYYEATIWLFFEGTDLNAYEKTVRRYASLVPEIKKVFPAHNTTPAEPRHLIDLELAFESIKNGEAKEVTNSERAHPQDTVAACFKFETFSFLIGKEQLRKIREVKN
jgi:glyoxylase-like metal-dependent hydrolase (beta-lactamase superfamily II)